MSTDEDEITLINHPRIYLAGPDVFLPNAKGHAAELKAICAEYQLEGVFPLDVDLELDELSPLDKAIAIFTANVNLIRNCQGVLANMVPFRGPSMDVGTAWEMGFAYNLGLPIVGYSRDTRGYPERVVQYRTLRHEGTGNPSWSEAMNLQKFDDPDFVESFGLTDNLMLDCSTRGVKASFRGAVERLRHVLQDRGIVP